ncbi:tetratricopeptide repeat protein [Devosia sp.]|uniref:tetratricopeptide repeat protein n=1 Tax=Devosia sp. TaxID=1871048 RepID=UPI0019E2CAB8|nr:tetratricopeptide repeat protein [Devosia sp.]MBE0578130.1 sel1 repeat family protein [Devosia sp.]
MRWLVTIVVVLVVWGTSATGGEWEDAMAAFDAERFDEAFSLMTPLAKAGHMGAQDKLFHLYYYGEGTAMDRVEAWFWAQRAADQGSALGQFNLGTVILAGAAPGVHSNTEAMRWLRLSADQGYGPALNNLAILLGAADGDRDIATLVSLATKAAEQDMPEALFAMAIAHLRGTPPYVRDSDLAGTFPIDEALAADLLSRAARQWHLDSLVLLAGQNMRRDAPTAVLYLRVAASKGCLAAGPLLQLAMAQLDTEELLASDQRTRDWMSDNPDPKRHDHSNFGVQGACRMSVLDLLKPLGPAAGAGPRVQT